MSWPLISKTTAPQGDIFQKAVCRNCTNFSSCADLQSFYSKYAKQERRSDQNLECFFHINFNSQFVPLNLSSPYIHSRSLSLSPAEGLQFQKLVGTLSLQKQTYKKLQPEKGELGKYTVQNYLVLVVGIIKENMNEGLLFTTDFYFFLNREVYFSRH